MQYDHKKYQQLFHHCSYQNYGISLHSQISVNNAPVSLNYTTTSSTKRCSYFFTRLLSFSVWVSVYRKYITGNTSSRNCLFSVPSAPEVQTGEHTVLIITIMLIGLAKGSIPEVTTVIITAVLLYRYTIFDPSRGEYSGVVNLCEQQQFYL